MPEILRDPVGPQDHIRGHAGAPITLVEYGDFECPYCARAYPIVKSVYDQMGNQLRVVYRHFPLTEIHPHAEDAAESAEAAGARGRFWPMHDMLFENQDALDDPELVLYAAEVGIDPEWEARALRTHAYANRVRDDVVGGVQSGVNGTPTFFIGDVRYDGPWDEGSLLSALRGAAASAS